VSKKFIFLFLMNMGVGLQSFGMSSAACPSFGSSGWYTDPATTADALLAGYSRDPLMPQNIHELATLYTVLAFMSLQIDFETSLTGDEGFMFADDAIAKNWHQLLCFLENSRKNNMHKSELIRCVLDAIQILNNLVFFRTEELNVNGLGGSEIKNLRKQKVADALAGQDYADHLTYGEAAIVEYALHSYYLSKKHFRDCASLPVFQVLMRVMYKMVVKLIKTIGYIPAIPADANEQLKRLADKESDEAYEARRVKEIQKSIGVRGSKKPQPLKFPEEALLCCDWVMMNQKFEYFDARLGMSKPQLDYTFLEDVIRDMGIYFQQECTRVALIQRDQPLKPHQLPGHLIQTAEFFNIGKKYIEEQFPAKG
jgi:hypothetical protein